MGRRRRRSKAEKDARDRARGQALPAAPEAPILPVRAPPSRFRITEADAAEHQGFVSVRWGVRGRGGQISVTVAFILYCAMIAIGVVLAVFGGTTLSGLIKGIAALGIAAVGLNEVHTAWTHEHWILAGSHVLSFGTGQGFTAGTTVRATDIDQIYVVRRRVRFHIAYDVVLRHRSGGTRVLFTTSSAQEAWWIQQFVESQFQIVPRLVEGSHRRPIAPLPEARMLTDGQLPRELPSGH
jgi:hypothetical protein